MSDGARGMHTLPNHEEIDQSPYLSGASTATSIDNSSLPVRPDIHPYLEIGKCLQSLRRSVFDMYHEELQRSPHFQPNQPGSVERDSTPTGGSSSNPHDVLMTPGISLAASLRTFHINAEENAPKSQHSVSFQLDEPTVSSDQKSLYANVSSERVAMDDASTSAAAMVTHSIATIVNQHEEKFVRYAPIDGSNNIFVVDTYAAIIILHCYHVACRRRSTTGRPRQIVSPRSCRRRMRRTALRSTPCWPSRSTSQPSSNRCSGNSTLPSPPTSSPPNSSREMQQLLLWVRALLRHWELCGHLSW